jgi:hypothetical protein
MGFVIPSEIDSYLLDSEECRKLAYWGVTTKIENPFRDGFAYYLHRKYKNFLVAREFSDGHNLRCDLCIIDDNDPKSKVYIEFKACHTYNLLNRRTLNLFFDKMEKDRQKYNNDKNVYFVLLATRIIGNVDLKFDGVVKYLDQLRSFQNEHGDINVQKEFPPVETRFSESFNLLAVKSTELGKYKEYAVWLDYFIFTAK